MLIDSVLRNVGVYSVKTITNRLNSVEYVCPFFMFRLLIKNPQWRNLKGTIYLYIAELLLLLFYPFPPTLPSTNCFLLEKSIICKNPLQWWSTSGHIVGANRHICRNETTKQKRTHKSYGIHFASLVKETWYRRQGFLFDVTYYQTTAIKPLLSSRTVKRSEAIQSLVYSTRLYGCVSVQKLQHESSNNSKK